MTEIAAGLQKATELIHTGSLLKRWRKKDEEMANRSLSGKMSLSWRQSGHLQYKAKLNKLICRY